MAQLTVDYASVPAINTILIRESKYDFKSMLKTAEAKYRIIKEENLVIETYTGRVSILDILELRSKIIYDKNFSVQMKFLIDIRAITTDYDERGVYMLLGKLRKHLHVLKASQTAIVTAAPLQAEYTKIDSSFTDTENNTHGIYSVCFKTDLALNWLGVTDVEICQLTT